MLQAVKAVRKKSMGYIMASKTFNVPRATLFRYCQNNEDSLTLNKQRLGRKPVISEELEKKLVDGQKICWSYEKRCTFSSLSASETK
nr:unnamed protein product [Callosobruchus chinensis]